MKTLIFIFSIALLVASSNPLIAQDEDKFLKDSLITGNAYTFYMKGTYKVFGTLLSSDSIYYTVNSDNGYLKFKKTEVKKITSEKELYSRSEYSVSEVKDTSVVFTLETKDGNSIDGKVISRDSAYLYYKTLSGIEMKIPLESIVSLIPLKGEIVEGKYLRRDPNESRLFIAPTARPLRAGNGYFSSNELLFPMLAFGIGDYVSAAGGISIIPGATGQLFYFNIKVTPIQLKGVDIAGGLLYAGTTFEDGGSAGIGYLVGTFGNTQAAFTAGLGFGFSGEEGFAGSPVLMLGGELRISSSVKLITENWILTSKDTPSFLSFGVRFFGSKVAGDFGLIFPTQSWESGFPALPFLGFTYNFDL